MFNLPPLLLNLAVALGIGLLIGAERERRKGQGPARAPAGIRTFSVVALAGAISVMVGGALVLAVTVAGVVALTAVAYFRSRDEDPGLTTEIALVLTALLGGLAMQQPALAAGIAVALAALLAARTPLHHFVSSVLTEAEVRDALIFAGATLVVLPLLPNQAMGPYDALNPRSIWIVVILVMAISAAGYILIRLLGARFGLPIAGIAAGFISSTATIGAMGTRVQKVPGTVTHRGGRRRGALDRRDHRADVRGARRHQHRHVARAFAPTDLRRHRRDSLWRLLHDPDPARKGNARSPARTGVQPPGRADIRPDTRRDADCLRRTAGLVRRDRSPRRSRGCRLRRHPLRRHRRCFAGGVRKDDRRRRGVSCSRRAVNQHHQQDHFCLEQRNKILRVAPDPSA